MPSLVWLGSHFALLRHTFVIPMRQFSLVCGLHFYEHVPSPCSRLDKPLAKRFLGFIEDLFKPWPPFTWPTQPSLTSLFFPFPWTKHTFKTSSSFYVFFLFAPLKLNFIALSQKTSTWCGGHCLQTKCATNVCPPLKEIDVFISAYVSFCWTI